MRRSRGRAARAALPALAAIALGCASEAQTSIDAVVTEAEPGLGQRLDLVRVVFRRVSASEGRVIDRTPVYERERFAPIVERLSPSTGDTPGELYRIRAEGLVGTDTLVAVQHRVVFVPGRRIVLPLRFAPECISLGCGDDETCEGGRCVSDLAATCAMDSGIAPDVCSLVDGGAGEGGPVPDGGEGSDARPPPPPGPDAAVPCVGCDDGLACTDDGCLLDGTCTHVVNDARCPAGQLCIPPAGCAAVGCAADADCDDGDGCTRDACVGGSCARLAIRCSALGRCTAGRCDPAIGCIVSPVEDGVPCGDRLCCGAVCVDPAHSESSCGACGNPCELGSSCIDSACRPCALDAECNDLLACTSDTCVAGRCVRTAVGSCLIEGTCVAAGERDPTNSCRRCDPAMRTDGWTAERGGTPCEDGSACTEDDRCSEGRCIAGTPLDCSDGEICTEDACSESGGCVHTVVRSHCVIDGACYGEGQSASSDRCLVCDPRSDARAWTRRVLCE